MITVSILINGRPLIVRSACNATPDAAQTSPSRYKVDDGRIIEHARIDGAVSLAMKMLTGVHQPDLDFSDTPKDKLDEALLRHVSSLAPVVIRVAPRDRKARKTT